MSKFKNWIEFFDASPSGSKIDKKKMEDLFKWFGASVSNDEIKLKLEMCGETVFLGKNCLTAEV